MKRLLNFFYKYLFLIFLFFIFFLEGTGFFYGRESAYFVILAMPFFLFLLDIIKKKEIIFPSKLTILFICFLFICFLSIFFSTNITTSFKEFLFLVSVFLISVYMYNHKNEVEDRVNSTLVITAFVFMIFPFFAKKLGLISEIYVENLIKAIPGTAHNVLGDFLGIILLISLNHWLDKKKRMYILFILIFTFSFLFSFSRTAYLSFFLVTAYMLFRHLKTSAHKRYILIVPLLIISLLFLILTNTEMHQIKWFNRFYQVLSTEFNYKNKSIISDRNYYYDWAFKSIKDRPLLGIGLGNYTNAAIKYSRMPLYISPSSTNIFFDYFVEGGILVGVLFIIIMLHMLRRCSFSPVIMYLFLSFQTYWWYRFYSIFLLFFVLISLYMKESDKKTYHININKITLAGFILLMASLLILSSNLSNKMYNYKQAFYLFPLNQDALFNLAEETIKAGDIRLGYAYIEWGIRLTPGCSSCLNAAGNLYLNYGNRKKALQTFIKAYNWNPYTLEYGYRRFPPGQKLIIRKIFELEKQLYGGEKAKQFFDSYMRVIKKSIFHTSPGSSLVYDDAKVVCHVIYQNEDCPYKF